MIYLSEREIGFDENAIGFPSIGGCRAIVLVTQGGLFGYHLNGSLNPGKRTAFVNFVNHHNHGNGKRTLYAASMGRGFTADHNELRDIAAAFVFSGSIYWAALRSPGSAYVHFQDINHNTCSITSRPWIEQSDNVPTNKGPYVPGANRAMANGAAPQKMYTNLSMRGLHATYPRALQE